MSHIKYETGKGETERWSINRENMRFCVRTKCPHMSFGTCLKPKCILRKDKNKLDINLLKL